MSKEQGVGPVDGLGLADAIGLLRDYGKRYSRRSYCVRAFATLGRHLARGKHRRT